MVEEAKAEGVPADQMPSLLRPVQVRFQGEPAKIFLVKCGCGKEYISFIDIINREKIATTMNDLIPYYPNIAEDTDLRKRYLEPKRRDVFITKEEFARRVALEKNQMVREAIERKVTEAGFGVTWVRPKLAYSIDPAWLPSP